MILSVSTKSKINRNVIRFEYSPVEYFADGVEVTTPEKADAWAVYARVPYGDVVTLRDWVCDCETEDEAVIVVNLLSKMLDE